MDEVAPSVLDRLGEGRRSTFDHNLARVIARALDKRAESRYQSVDEMHEAVYSCLIDRGEAVYRHPRPPPPPSLTPPPTSTIALPPSDLLAWPDPPYPPGPRSAQALEPTKRISGRRLPVGDEQATFTPYSGRGLRAR
jgi:hypothetical protein